ncbi:uncharacterized protein LOC105190102 isoform X2 [Harpegnathos saltator]|nr:uncharacterized protein LOC105190102 isoform X2 [Harpegnathos saltator]
MRQYNEKNEKQNVQNTEKIIQSCTSDLNNITHTMTDMSCYVDKMSEKQSEPVVSYDTWLKVDDSNISMQWHSPKVLNENTSPPPWFTEYMESMKKQMMSTITQEVVKQMKEILNEHLDSFTSLISDETNQSRRRSHSSLSKRHLRCSFDSHLNAQLNERNHKTVNAQDEGQFSDASIEQVDEPEDLNINMNAKDHCRQLQQTKLLLNLNDLDNIKDIHEILKEKQYYRIDEMTNNLDISANNKQGYKESVQNVNDNNVQEDVTPICSMTSDALKILDGELRMNCSITGNRALNVDSFHENTWCDDLTEDIDKISHCSGCSIAADERKHVDTFVMVDMPTSENTDPPLAHSKVFSIAELQQRDNSRDSPSFELLSETPSPRSSSCIDEEHFVNVFSTNEEDLQTTVEIPKTVTSSAYMVDIYGKIYNEHLPISNTNVEFEKRSDGVYSFVAETLPVRETRSSKPSHTEQQTFCEQKSSQYNTTDSNDEQSELPNCSKIADDQHQESSAEFHWRMNSQSQTDASDFMQSFHSHTTSVTDNNNDCFYQSCHSYAKQKTMTKDAQKATTIPRKVTWHTTREKKSGRARMDETYRDDWNKFRSQQSSRTTGLDGSNWSRSSSGEQVPNATADPVLILPETLLTMAAQVGSIAYVTARDMFDKLRLHTKEDPVKHRHVKVNTATNNCSSSWTTRRPANQS